MKRFLFLSVCLGATIGSLANPAKRVTTTHKQSDGTEITVTLAGDEFHHSLITQDGMTIERGKNGDFFYRNLKGLTNVRAHNLKDRKSNEISFLNAQRKNLTMQATLSQQSIGRRKSAELGRPRLVNGPRKVGATQVPTTASPRIPVLLVQYSDKKMSNTKSTFVSQYTQGSNSVHQYFVDQSNGLYSPQFDVYGIYTLNSTRATYGGNSGGNDKGVARMVGEAIDKAGSEIDWSKYDNDGDGEADVCIVVYAGPGEAQGATSDAVWPCQWSLAAGKSYNDGTGTRTRNNTKIDRFAVFNETNGSSDSNTKIDGIGTFCHEFSHCLGLPDFYETTYSNGYYGIGSWSLMDYGSYNNNGYTPIGYNAYEKNFMGWLDYETPKDNTKYTLPVFNKGNDKAVKITSQLNSNEYFILENRAKQGWDSYIQDEGLMITHVTYVASRWTANTVNNNAVQLMTIIPADNTLSTKNESTDLFGQTNHAFTKSSTPASKLNLKSSGSLASTTGGAGTLDKPVTDIQLNSDGTVSFWYVKGTEEQVATPTLKVTPSSISFGTIETGKTSTKSISLSASDLKGNVTATLSDANGVFSIDKTSITAATAQNGTTLNVTFKPTRSGTYNATLTLSSTGATSVKINLSATASDVQADKATPLLLSAQNVTDNSFQAKWSDESTASLVKSYTLWLNEITPDNPSVEEPKQLQSADFTSYTAYAYGGRLYNAASYYSYYLPKGWTTGRTLYVANGSIIPGSYIKSNSFSVPSDYSKISVVIKAYSYTSSQASLTVSTLKGGSKARATLGTSSREYVYVLDAKSTEQINIAASNYPAIESITIYAGDITAANARAASAREITGITNNYYNLSNLTAGNTYQFKVKAVYTDGTESAWSNQEEVTLAGEKRVIAGVNGVSIESTSKVKYYDLKGNAISKPAPGVNIVIITNEDGTTTRKKLFIK